MTKKSSKTAKSPLPKDFPTERKSLVLRLLSHKMAEINWPIELCITKHLFKEYPYPDFWNNLNPPFELDSLGALRSEWGKEYLRRSYNLYLYKKDNQNPKIILQEKIGESILVHNKPKTLKDFLK